MGAATPVLGGLSRACRGAAFGLAGLSGAAALGHQLLWTRRLVDVLGASANTFSSAIGAFFIGLACGAWLAARGRPTQGGWRAVALAEFAVAILALPLLFSSALVERAGHWVGLGGWTKVLVPLVFITPPAMAMGFVIPLMVRSLAVQGVCGPKHVVWLYAVNTFGGVLGIVLVVFEGLPRFGLLGASLGAVGLNVAVGVGVPLAEYVRGAHRSGKALVPERFQAAHDAGQFMLTVEIAATLRLPALENLRAQIDERLPAALRQDRQADWKQWPMRMKPVRPPAQEP